MENRNKMTRNQMQQALAESTRRAFERESMPEKRVYKVLDKRNNSGMPDITPMPVDPERDVNESFANQFQDQEMLLSEEEKLARERALEGLKKLKEAQMQGQVPEHLKALIKK